jgi:hypothetical protein
MRRNANYYAAVLGRNYDIETRVLGSMLIAGSTNSIQVKLLRYSRKKQRHLLNYMQDWWLQNLQGKTFVNL